ncbi:MAG TPA: rhomboid family intramembrane serine protease [Humisphaera sp.]
MFLPLRTDSPLRTTPYMNWAIIAANLVVFVAQVAAKHTLGGNASTAGASWDRAYHLDAVSPQLVQFVSYGFLHGGVLHVVGNMLFLYIFGNNVNDKMGHVGYLFFYLSAVAAAGIGYLAFESQRPMIGASGGVAAVVGAYLVLFPRSSITILVFFVIIGTFEVACFWFVAAFFLMDIFGLTGQSDTAHTAHIAGTLFGVAVSAALLWAGLLPRDQFDIVAMAKQWNRRRQYRDAVSGGWNPYAAAAPEAGAPRPAGGWVRAPEVAPPPPSPRVQQALDLRAEIAEAIAHHKLADAARLYLQLKAVDPSQVLARQSQLDVANQLAAEQKYSEAAEAYESFLRHYPKYEQNQQLELMLGLILNRFLNQPGRAREYLLRAQAKLMDENGRAMARQELEKVDKALAGAGGGGEGATGTSGAGLPNMGGAM